MAEKNQPNTAKDKPDTTGPLTFLVSIFIEYLQNLRGNNKPLLKYLMDKGYAIAAIKQNIRDLESALSELGNADYDTAVTVYVISIELTRLGHETKKLGRALDLILEYDDDPANNHAAFNKQIQLNEVIARIAANVEELKCELELKQKILETAATISSRRDTIVQKLRLLETTKKSAEVVENTTNSNKVA